MFFIFKQKTAYEMRISDWSSDVCSSDLLALPSVPHGRPDRADIHHRQHQQQAQPLRALHYFGEIEDRLEVREVAPKGGRRHQQMIFDKPGDGFRLRRSQAKPGAEVPRDIPTKHARIAPAPLGDSLTQDRKTSVKG